MKSFVIGMLLLMPFFDSGNNTTPIEANANSIWLTDYEAARTRALAEDKVIMLYFSGSDWCKPCIKLKREIFNTDTFINYAQGNLVTVMLDFPRLKKNRLPKEQMERNEALAARFNQEGAFPLVVFIDKNEHVLAKSGYQAISPEDYIKYIEKIIAPYQN